MKLRKIVDNIKPNFIKGGKYSYLESLFDSIETLLFIPNEVSKSGVHIHDHVAMKRVMSVVIKALVPCLLFGVYNVGYQHYSALVAAGQIAQMPSLWEMLGYGLWLVVPIILVTYGVGLTIEIFFAQKAGHGGVHEGFLVTGFLLPLIVPPTIPLWQVAIATAFAVIVGKEIFGGTGRNIWNPALLARAFLFFSYPSDMSGSSIWVAGSVTKDGVTDAISAATPLADIQEGVIELPYSIMDMFLGFMPGSVGETSKLAILLGAVVLIVSGVGKWRIMLSGVVGLLSIGLLFNWGGFEFPAWQHLLIGGFLFGIVFMATDPVSASQTIRGQWIYGFLIGAFTIIIRVVNPAYPEGAMLAILLMNSFAPLIDYYIIQSNIKKRLKRSKQVAQA